MLLSKRMISVLAISGGMVLASAAKIALGQGQDCNGNGIDDACDIDCGPPNGFCDVPGCGQSGDCNANGIPDECDVVSGGIDIFATGLDLPEDIVPSQDAYPPGFFVTDFNANAVWHVSPDGGSVAQHRSNGQKTGGKLGDDPAIRRHVPHGVRVEIRNEEPRRIGALRRDDIFRQI